MQRRILFIASFACLLALAALTTGLVRAASSSGYDLPWWSVDGGGGTSNATGYSLGGSVGQPDAGELSGTGFQLAGGFWMGVGAIITPTQGVKLYLPLIVR